MHKTESNVIFVLINQQSILVVSKLKVYTIQFIIKMVLTRNQTKQYSLIQDIYDQLVNRDPVTTWSASCTEYKHKNLENKFNEIVFDKTHNIMTRSIKQYLDNSKTCIELGLSKKIEFIKHIIETEKRMTFNKTYDMTYYSKILDVISYRSNGRQINQDSIRYHGLEIMKNLLTLISASEYQSTNLKTETKKSVFYEICQNHIEKTIFEEYKKKNYINIDPECYDLLYQVVIYIKRKNLMSEIRQYTRVCKISQELKEIVHNPDNYNQFTNYLYSVYDTNTIKEIQETWKL